MRFVSRPLAFAVFFVAVVCVLHVRARIHNFQGSALAFRQCGPIDFHPSMTSMSLMLRRCCTVGAFCGISFAVWVSATPSGHRLRQRFAGWVARGKILVRLADDLLSASADSDGTLGHWRARILAAESRVMTLTSVLAVAKTEIDSRLDSLEDLVGGLDVYEIERRVTALAQETEASFRSMREDWHGSERAFIRRWGEIHVQATAVRAEVSDVRENLIHARQVALRVSDFCEQLDARMAAAYSRLGDLAGRVALLEGEW